MIEEQVINHIINDKDPSIIILNQLTEDYFPTYKAEFNFINNHIKKYNTVPDKTTFLSSFPDFDVFEVTEPVSYLTEELFAHYQTNTLVKSYNAIRQDINNDKKDEALKKLKDTYESLTSTGVSLNCVDILRDTSRYDDYVERLQDFDKYYVKTGLPELDAIIGGWDKQEELATIVARTNTGKTWLMLKFAVSAAEQGLNVGIYSGEMSEKKIGYRVDTLIQHISNGALIHGGASVQNDYKTYIENLPNRFKGSIKVLTPKMINGAAGVSALRAFIQKEKLDILFIDQHSLLEDDRGAKNPVERAANISKDLKNLQVLMRIPFIAVSQQNRTTTENGTGTEHIAQSDRIGQDSTCILFFERNDKNDKNLLTIDLVKSRDSENGKKLNYHVDFNTGTFTFIPGEDNVGSEKAKEYNREYETGGEDVF